VKPVFLRPLPQSRSSSLPSIRSIAHMQIPLIGGTRTGAGAADSPQAGQGQGLGRYRGSPSLVPITLLMHREAGRAAALDGMQEPESDEIPAVTVLIGGHCIGGSRPLVWTDDLEGFSLTAPRPVTSGSLSLHSLGIGGSSMLCVKSDPLSLSGAEESFLLSGPVGLFRGPASGINGTVAEAILKTFRTLHSARGYATDGEEEESREELKGTGCSSIVAEIIALMLLIQSEVPPTPRSLRIHIHVQLALHNLASRHVLHYTLLCVIPSSIILISLH
jgi:hypothetical protein